MEEEFAFHLEMETARLRALGRSPDQARRQALLAFGGSDRYREEMRDSRGLRWLHDAVDDLRYAMRIHRRRLGLSMAVALTLGIGVGVNGFTYAVIDGILVRPLPARNAGQLVAVFPRDASTGQIGTLGYDDYLDFRDKSGAFADVAGTTGTPMNLVASQGGLGAADMVWGEMVTENYFSVLDMTPALGRFFTAADAPQGANAFAVLSYPSWRDRFNGDAGVIGRTVRVNGTDFTVVAVAPKHFKGLRLLGYWPELWVPVGMWKTVTPGFTNLLTGRGSGLLTTFARLHDGWTIDRTTDAATAFARQLDESRGLQERQRTVMLMSARSGFENPQIIKPRVLVLSSALGMFASIVTLLVICANLANLQLARAAARRREIGIRLALGCSRFRLGRQLLAEMIVLAFPGAIVAALILLAAPVIEPLLFPRFLFRVGIDLTPNLRIALVTTAVGLTAVVCLGIIPAFRSARTNLTGALVNVVGAPRRMIGRRVTLRGVLVVSQLALSVVLLVASALFARSLATAETSDLGFDPRAGLLTSVNVRLQGYDQPKARQFYDDVIARVRALPETQSAAWVFPVPFDTEDLRVMLLPEGAANSSTSGLRTSVSFVGDDFVNALGLKLLQGRAFNLREAAADRSLVVSQSLAARLWPGQDAIGRRVRINSTSADEMTVVGVVQDATFDVLGISGSRRAYLSLTQQSRGWQTLIVRTRGPERAVAPRIRAIVTAADPLLPVFGVLTLEDAVANGHSPSRIAAGAAAISGVLALLIAAVGLYAVVTWSVAERTREIGLRLALGAARTRLMRHVMASGIRLTAYGIAVGLAGAAGLAQVMGGLLVGIQPFDPLSFGLVPLVLCAVAIAATYVPARRAARLDPMAALREE
jgi:predicted permease